MRFDVVSLFPNLIGSALYSGGVITRALERDLIQVHTWNPRAFTTDLHRTVDDRPYGGGAGMLLKPEPLAASCRHIARYAPESKVVLLSAKGRNLDWSLARELAQCPSLTLVCGRYEGVDQRFIERYVAMEVAYGSAILAGGEIPALALIEASARWIPEVLGNPQSLLEESLQLQQQECPHYTRPHSFEGLTPPAVLLSGNHAEVADWRAHWAS